MLLLPKFSLAGCMVPRADVPLTNFTVIAYAHCGLSQVLFSVRIVSPLKAREVDFAVRSLVRLVCLVGKGRELSKNNYSLLPNYQTPFTNAF